jgi:hypothetical protein
MPQYLVTSYLPDDFDPSAVTGARDRIIDNFCCQSGIKAFFCQIREVDGVPQNGEVKRKK